MTTKIEKHDIPPSTPNQNQYPESLEKLLDTWTNAAEMRHHKKSYVSKVNKVALFLINEIEKRADKRFEFIERDERNELLRAVVGKINMDKNKKWKKKRNVAFVYKYICSNKL